jgi:hypothetical protein
MAPFSQGEQAHGVAAFLRMEEFPAPMGNISTRVGSPVGFLLGALCAASIVLAFAGASLALIDARTRSADGFGSHGLARPSLATRPAA